VDEHFVAAPADPGRHAQIISDRLLKDVSGPTHKDSKWQVGYTYSGHPVCCAAGVANIELMEESDILRHVQAVGPRFQAGLKTLEALPLVHETRGIMLMAGIQLVDHTKGDKKNKEAEDLNTEQCTRISDKTLAANILVRMQRNRAVISPCLVISADEIEQVPKTQSCTGVHTIFAWKHLVHNTTDGRVDCA
jgi:adenosylmethionine-8-amino-7-oxononanoate aminotransferase